ncbi:m(7)GTP pyrophosphatase [Gammaproteobacteria bacterium]
MRLVLASTSPYRRALLARLGLAFVVAAPAVDECPLPGEAARSLVMRLAKAKAATVAADYPEARVIGSDQVAVLETAEGERVLGKPGSRERAIEQLDQLSGRSVTFLTGLCLLNTRTQHCQVDCEPFRVDFRPLSRAQITTYIDRENPLDCAGSFKSEGLGIVLFERLAGDDPNALVGLPLIRLIRMLEADGLMVLSP